MPVARDGLFRDRTVGTLRQRAQYVEDTNLQCRLAACLAEEAVSGTHVRMASSATTTCRPPNTLRPCIQSEGTSSSTSPRSRFARFINCEKDVLMRR